MDLNKIVTAKIDDLIQSGEIAKKIETGVELAITDAINEQFRSYGKINEQLKQLLESGLRIDSSQIDFDSYNQQMLIAVKQKINGLFAETAQSKFMVEIDKLLEPAPQEITLVELVNKIIECLRNDFSDDYDDFATIEFKENDYPLEDTFSLKIITKKGVRYSHSLNDEVVNLHMNKSSIRINHRQNYNPTCFSEHEALIFKLYSAGTKITGIEDFDESECDTRLIED